MRGHAIASGTALLAASQRWRSRERRYRPLTPRRNPVPLTQLATELRLSSARALRQLEASVKPVAASNARMDEVQRLAGIVRQLGQAPVSIETMNAAIADAGASAGRASVGAPRRHWPGERLPITEEEREWLEMPDVGAEILPDCDWAAIDEQPDGEDKSMGARIPSLDEPKA